MGGTAVEGGEREGWTGVNLASELAVGRYRQRGRRWGRVRM